MRKLDSNRVFFYSKEDLAGGYQLRKGESILRAETKLEYNDINDVLELYNVKKYIDNELFLKDWTSEDILKFKNKAIEFGSIIGKFIVNINNSNVIHLYDKILRNYTKSFWELVNNQHIFKRISQENFQQILLKEPHLIHTFLTHKNIVSKYNIVIKDFLLNYSKSAEILLSIYEVEDSLDKNKKMLPKSLTAENKETIILNYLDSDKARLGYIEMIQNFRNRSDFKISDKTKLKAKHLYRKETRKILGKGAIKYGVSVSFQENTEKPKYGYVDDNLMSHYLYSIDFIKKYNNPYQLFQNFKYLFEYLDIQNRINLVAKRSEMGLFDLIGVHSKNEYRGGVSFRLSEMTSSAQISSYDEVLKKQNNSLVNIVNYVFSCAFQEKYSFAENARFSVPTATSYFEKVRLLAPEFESMLKQFKLFVEDGRIDFELLQISSLPSSMEDIPSLNSKKYIYLNENNQEIVSCSNFFFSDQTLLTHIEPFKNRYTTFFDLLSKENVNFEIYEEHQKHELNYLMEKGFIKVDESDFLRITNLYRVLILKDLYNNEVGSYYHYPIEFQQEVQRMADENIVNFESSLFSKTEQAYFNYFLNKKEFTNGLDLRNSYLHGTQATSEEVEKHQYAYFVYLKLIFLALLKMDDDLNIYDARKGD